MRILLLDGHGSHVTPEFMQFAHQHRIQLVYLPAHSSHITQPLNLGVFGPLKKRYKNFIIRNAHFDNAAAVKKHKFNTFYAKARNEVLSESLIQSAWRTAGLLPWNPNKVVNSSQILDLKPKPEDITSLRPQTPPNQASSDPIIGFKTPMNRKDIMLAKDQLKRRNRISRSQKILLQKIARGFKLGNLKLARVIQENQELKAKLNALGPQVKRKRVHPNPNYLFININALAKAIGETNLNKEDFKDKNKTKRA